MLYCLIFINKSKSIIFYLQLQNVCRICLGSGNEQILFNAKLDFTCQTVCELINYITNVDIDDEEQDSILPQQVCCSCLENLRISFNLKRLAHESNNYLKDLTESANFGLNIKKETSEDPLVKQENRLDYYECSFPDFSDLSVERVLGNMTRSTTRSQSIRQNAKERSQKARKAAERRANETMKQKTDRNQREANRIAQIRRRRIESPEERASRLEKIARRAAERRANETPEQKTERNQREARRIAQRRSANRSNNQQEKG